MNTENIHLVWREHDDAVGAALAVLGPGGTLSRSMTDDSAVYLLFENAAGQATAARVEVCSATLVALKQIGRHGLAGISRRADGVTLVHGYRDGEMQTVTIPLV